MLKKFILLFTLIISLYSYSQEMEKYKKVTGQIVPIRTETIEKKFKNGQIKEIKTLTTYEYNGEEYIYFSGEYILYSKKGIVLLKRVHNKFGSPLSIKSSHQR